MLLRYIEQVSCSQVALIKILPHSSSWFRMAGEDNPGHLTFHSVIRVTSCVFKYINKEESDDYVCHCSSPANSARGRLSQRATQNVTTWCCGFISQSPVIPHATFTKVQDKYYEICRMHHSPDLDVNTLKSILHLKHSLTHRMQSLVAVRQVKMKCWKLHST